MLCHRNRVNNDEEQSNREHKTKALRATDVEEDTEQINVNLKMHNATIARVCRSRLWKQKARQTHQLIEERDAEDADI